MEPRTERNESWVSCQHRLLGVISHTAGSRSQPTPSSRHPLGMPPPVQPGERFGVRGMRVWSSGKHPQFVLGNDFLGVCKCHNAKPLHEYSKLGLPFDAAIPLLGTKENWTEAGSQRDICSHTFTATLPKTAKRQKPPKCLWTSEWINKRTLHTRRNSTQPQEGGKSWHMLQHRWTLRTSC